MATHPNILTWRMDRRAWWATVHGVAKSLIRLSDSHYFFFFFNIYFWLCLVFIAAQAFSGCGGWGLLFSNAQASLVVEHRL